ncbi:differentially expressed in FDCP 6 homolog [Electrophorus electricus]|uniref:differentially expressed in FDCP 6 homolog n=1 Tax=Electrophorus electricus TaxID=8005 RepID=UPI0015D038FC|nr:differentially expressed in FDCP 6 homolog [Electrophorus electricus]
MDLKSELLKSIWYAFTSLDVEHSGKVSKSQLKVLSHNLYTALNIPHDPVALEEHFQDNDNGPVSNQGYMPYLNKYILAKATEGTFNKETFDELCWMMAAKKNFKPSIQQGSCSQRDCFKLFCLFNLLSEDHYPLIISLPELEYLLKKISAAMSQEWDGKLLEALLAQEISLHSGLSVWLFLEHLGAGHLMQLDSKETFSLALDEVFMEMYHNVLKKGYMQKKGHVRRNWQERWFVLKPDVMEYYVSEDLKEKKGELQLDGSCVVETIPDKEGRRCLFCVKTPGRTYEMSASDQKQRVEWIQAAQTAIRLKTEGKSSLHKELKLRRRELRELSQNRQSGQQMQSSESDDGGQSDSNGQSALRRVNSEGQRSDDSSQRTQSSQSEPSPKDEWSSLETQHEELDLGIIDIIQQHMEMEAQRKDEEARETEKQNQKQRELERQLKEANAAKETLEAELAKMQREANQQKERIRELELTQQKLEEVLNLQTQARLEEERARCEVERQLEEEQRKLSELLLLQRRLETSAPAERTQEEEKQTLEDVELRPSPASNSQPSSHSTQPPAEAVETHSSTLEKVSETHSKVPHMRQWNVQMNRLMKPITPADKLKCLPVKSTFPKYDKALTSTEFITKYQTNVTQETEFSDRQLLVKGEEAGSKEPVTVPETEELQMKNKEEEQTKELT